MTRVVAIILHALSGAGAGPLEAAFAAARAANAARQARGFESVGATARIVEIRPGGASFGERVREVVAGAGGGVVVLGSGSVPLATPADRRRFVEAASTPGGPVLANNRFSADIVALPAGLRLVDLPDLVADNGLPRWLAERDIGVADVHARWRLQVDLDSPLDALLAGLGRSAAAAPRATPDDGRVRAAAARVLAATADPAAELLVAGRSSSSTLAWLERNTASRTRALIEERGMRTSRGGQRSVRTTIGLLLDRDGPESLGAHLAELSDAAVVDTRVLLAHRLGTDESGWPRAEDRFASDLLLHERIGDPWLRALTRAAAEAPVPILLGGHTLVGPGLRLLRNLAA